MKKYVYWCFLTFPLLFSNCAVIKHNGWLKAHQTEINRIANDATLSGEQKMDALLSNYTVLVNEGLQFTNPLKGVKYIQKFQSQNQTAIDKILADSNKWMNNLNDMQTVSIAFRTAQKPYIRQLIDLVPKFQRKYEQYKFITEMTGKMANGFGHLGDKILKF